MIESSPNFVFIASIASAILFALDFDFSAFLSPDVNSDSPGSTFFFPLFS